MRTLALALILICSFVLLPGQDSLFFRSGKILEGDILKMNRKSITIHSDGIDQVFKPADVTYRLGDDYLTPSPWSIGFRFGVSAMGTGQSLRSLFEEQHLDGDLTNSFWGNRIDGPSTKAYPVIQLEVEHLISARTAYGVITGVSNEGKTEGSRSLRPYGSIGL